MSIPGAASPLFIGAAAGAAAGYQIDRSLRFNDDDSAYLNRTPSSAGNRKTWTWSGWVKRSSLSGSNFIFGAGSNIMAGGAHSAVLFQSDSKFQVYDYSGSAYAYRFRTTRVFRDPSAWYHLVVAIDTTQSAQTDRVKLYINGDLQDSFDQTTYPSQNYDSYVNTSSLAHQIGHSNSDTFDGYLTEVYFIDGQQLAASDFGEYDDNNNWNPKAYSGSYGTNGFYLKFADNSSNAALGTDSSGNSNTWTVNNLTAAGSAWDQSQTWSDDLSGTGVTFATRGFDGDVDSYSDSTGGWSLDLSGHTFGTGSHDIEVKSGGATSITVNGSTSLTDPGGGGAKVWTGTHTGEITSIASSATGASVYFVKIDDLLLVDNGVVDTAAKNIDSLIDTPTNYTAASGNNGGNYATLNPINLHSDITLSNGNLQIAKTNNAYRSAFSTIGASSGKWYFEVKPTANANEGMFIGIDQVGDPSRYIGQINGSNGFGWKEEGGLYQNDSNSSYGGSGYATNDIIGVAADLDNGTLTFYKNNTSQGTATSSLPSGTYFFGVSVYHSSTTAEVNYGSRPFAYTPPTGYVSLCTTNLPDPTIADGSTAMDALLYTGTGSTQTISGLGFSPDLAWIKRRSGTAIHVLNDTLRGAGKQLSSNSTDAEITNTNNFAAFTSDGFTVGTGSATNASPETHVAWAWAAGTSTVSNTDGSITSNVRASASNGFSIVSYNGDNNAGDTVGHGLNAAPEWIVIKNRDVSFTWYVYHAGIGATKYLRLDTTNAETTGSGAFNNTAPTSSVFSLGQDNPVNDGNKDYIAYCWAPVAGYSAFGSYTGNGSSDGPFVYTGMRPKFVLLRNTSRAENWVIYDSVRGNFISYLAPNTSDAEGSFTQPVFGLSNGFQLGDTRQLHNRSGDTYIYAAFAEHPFKTARAR